MAERILSLLENDDLRREMRERAAEDAAHRFGMERMVKNYFSFYESILKKLGFMFI
jgi:glycosyltransferase involved in cell wall biosynthesis